MAEPRKITVDPAAFKLLNGLVAVSQQAQGELNLALTAVLAAQGIAGEPVTVTFEDPNTLILTPAQAAPVP